MPVNGGGHLIGCHLRLNGRSNPGLDFFADLACGDSLLVVIHAHSGNGLNDLSTDLGGHRSGDLFPDLRFHSGPHLGFDHRAVLFHRSLDLSRYSCMHLFGNSLPSRGRNGCRDLLSYRSSDKGLNFRTLCFNTCRDLCQGLCVNRVRVQGCNHLIELGLVVGDGQRGNTQPVGFELGFRSRQQRGEHVFRAVVDCGRVGAELIQPCAQLGRAACQLIRAGEQTACPGCQLISSVFDVPRAGGKLFRAGFQRACAACHLIRAVAQRADAVCEILRFRQKRIKTVIQCLGSVQ